MMRAASGLLVAVLLTTCVISGTFAKYTTSAEGSDTARVATWGFKDTSSITLTDLFKDAYSNEENKETVKTSVTGENVIAPGTTNSAKFKFDYSGAKAKPEVAYTFKVDTTGSSCDNAIQQNKNIVWSLDGTKYVGDQNSTSWKKLLAAIEKLSGDETGTKEYQPGELPTAFNNGVNQEHTVSWEWKFDEGSNDQTDTNMGNAETLDNVTLKIAVTATQVD